MLPLQLTLMRHAKAVPGKGITDHERPLAERGIKDAAGMAAFAQREGLLPELILCSTAERAQQTAGIFREAVECQIHTIYLSELYLASASEILAAARAAPAEISRVMIIAHNPGMETLALALGGNQLTWGNMPSASLACFAVGAKNWADLRSAEQTLVALAWPKMLSLPE